MLTEPLRVHEHNWYLPQLETQVQALRADRAALDALALLKHRFMTHGEALIHGDLHSGSVMVGGGRTVAIDPEFAFYGPVGFDLGAIWANAIIAAVRASILGRPADFQAHVAAIVPVSWEAFRAELGRLWPARVDTSFGEATLSAMERSTWGDALGFAAAKMIRRMIGFAHVSDIETLDESDRVVAVGQVLRIARRLLVRRAGLGDSGRAVGRGQGRVDGASLTEVAEWTTGG